MQEVIKHAAVKAAEGGMIFIGKCHAHCFYKARHVGVEMSQKALDQGFVTNKGRYVNREEAMAIALAAKQVSYNANYLISEMLWSEQDAGLFDYDEIEGYKLKPQKVVGDIEVGSAVQLHGRELSPRWRGKKAVVLEIGAANYLTVECEGQRLGVFRNEVSIL